MITPPIYYLSGPMSGLPEHNYPRFLEAGAFLRMNNVMVANPAEYGKLGVDVPWQQYLKRDIRILLDCHGIVMLNGWKKSKGARLEYHIARELGLIILFLDDNNKLHREDPAPDPS